MKRFTKVSIVIPCRNEEKYIGKCLDSILNSDYDKSLLEVFVCDGMSEDKTESTILLYSQYSFIKLLKNKHKTTPYALNLGINNSSGDVIMILGAHAELSSDYISQCIATFHLDEKIGCVGGLLQTISEDEQTKSIAKAMSSSFGVGNAYFRTGAKEGYVDTVAFGAYKKEVFNTAGLFDESLTRNQDDEFNYRITKAGYKIYLNPSIKATYYSRSSLSKLFGQYFQYGYWKVFVNKKHHAITTFRQMIPAIFVIFFLTGSILAFISIFFLFAFLSIFFLYLLLACIAAAKAKNIKDFFMMLFAIFILHFSYGIGYIEGICNFIILRKKPAAQRTTLTR